MRGVFSSTNNALCNLKITQHCFSLAKNSLQTSQFWLKPKSVVRVFMEWDKSLLLH